MHHSPASAKSPRDIAAIFLRWLLLGLLLASAASLHAQVWIGGTSNQWFFPPNWSNNVMGTGNQAFAGGMTINIGFEGSPSSTAVANTLDLATTSGTTTFNVYGGLSSGIMSLGTSVGGHGVIDLSGIYGVMSAGNLNIGAVGSGSLTIRDGATATSGGTTIGANNSQGGTALVTGSGSSWTINSAFTVGSLSSGSLTVAAGGTFASTGNGAFNRGAAVTVTGTGSSLTIANDLILNTLSSGFMTVADGGVFTVSGTGIIHRNVNDTTINIGSAVGSAAVAAGTLNATSLYSDSNIAGSALLNFNHTTANHTFTPLITGNFSVQQNGSGKTTLLATNTYTGGTIINAGTLAAGAANFSGGSSLGASTGTVTVNAGGTLAGNDTILGATTVYSGGHVASDAGGLLRFDGGLTLGGGANLDFQLGSDTGQLSMGSAGVFTYFADGSNTGPVFINFSAGAGLAANTVYDLFSNNHGTFNLADFTVGSVGLGLGSDYALSVSGGMLQVTTGSAIPEPGTYAAIAGSLALGVVALRRRRV